MTLQQGLGGKGAHLTQTTTRSLLPPSFPAAAALAFLVNLAGVPVILLLAADPLVGVEGREVLPPAAAFLLLRSGTPTPDSLPTIFLALPGSAGTGGMSRSESSSSGDMGRTLGWEDDVATEVLEEERPMLSDLNEELPGMPTDATDGDRVRPEDDGDDLMLVLSRGAMARQGERRGRS